MTRNETSEKKPSGKPTALRQTGEWILHVLGMLKHNWPYKLISLMLAVIMWAVLITQDSSMTREKVMTISFDQVEVVGQANMENNGFILMGNVESEAETITIRAAVPQLYYQEATAANYKPTIKLNNIVSAGVQELTIETSSSTSYGVVREVSPATVTVDIDTRINRYRIPVNATTTGRAPDGWYAVVESYEPAYLALEGPSRLVNSVRSATAALDLSAIATDSEKSSMSVPLVLDDRNGGTVERKQLTITSDSQPLDAVAITYSVYPQKTFTLQGEDFWTGRPADGYEVKDVTFSVDTVQVAARREALRGMTALGAAEKIDVSGLNASATETVKLRIPDGAVYTSAENVTVTVEIGEKTQARMFSSLHLVTSGLGDGLSAELSHASGAVRLEGPQLWISSLSGSDLTLAADLSGITEPGTYSVPVTCTVEGDEDVLYSMEISPTEVEAVVTRQ